MGKNRGWADHGTDGGYYRHIRQTGEPVWGQTPCEACRSAHNAAETRRKAARPKRRPETREVAQPKPARAQRRCPDCDTPIGAQSRRCRSCAQKNRARIRRSTAATPPRWTRVGLIWKAA